MSEYRIARLPILREPIRKMAEMNPMRPLVGLLVLTLLSTSALAALAPADSAYQGYRIPEHRWSQWSAMLDGSTGQQSRGNVFGVESRRGSFSGRLATNAMWGYDSDPLQYGWGFSADLNGSRSNERTQSTNSFSTSSQNDLNKNLSQRLAVSGSIRPYPWRMPVGFSLRSDHALELRQSFNSFDRVSRAPPDEQQQARSRAQGDRLYRGTVSVGIGYGRVRDATPVYRVQVAEQRLLRTGALARPLSAAARSRLAALFAVQGDLVFAHQRPDKYFWKELERVLREDGALAPGSLDAFDVFRLLEPLALDRSVLRRTGFFVGPAVTLVTERDRASLKESSSDLLLSAGTVVSATGTTLDTLVEDRRDDVYSSFVAEYHRPLGSRWQTDFVTSASLTDSREFLFWSTSGSATFIVADRWLAAFSLNHSATAPGHGIERRVRSWRVNLGGELYYFLEDAWALRLSGGFGQSHSPVEFQRSSGIQLGLTYVVSGLFEAPGLVERMRPTPPIP